MGGFKLREGKGNCRKTNSKILESDDFIEGVKEFVLTKLKYISFMRILLKKKTSKLFFFFYFSH